MACVKIDFHRDMTRWVRIRGPSRALAYLPKTGLRYRTLIILWNDAYDCDVVRRAKYKVNLRYPEQMHTSNDQRFPVRRNSAVHINLPCDVTIRSSRADK